MDGSNSEAREKTTVEEAGARGGRARAERLTPEQRKEIARRAAEARWENEAPKATHEGEIRIGEIAIPCAVLEDGTRVVTQRGMFVALGRHKNPTKGQASIDDRPAFLSAKNLEPFIDEDLRRSWSPIKFRLSIGGGGYQGNIAFGYQAEILPRVCRVFMDADAAGKLLASQKHIAERARILLGGLATVGIVSLIDEATGYQDVRARNALADILEAFIAKELRKWVRTFPPEFYKHMFKLRNIPYNGAVKRPQYIGHLTNDLVYSRLAPGVMQELQEKNPTTENGRRKNKHHQWLTEDHGHPELRAHLKTVIALMENSDTWEQFYRMLERSLPKHIELPLLDWAESGQNTTGSGVGGTDKAEEERAEAEG